MWVLGIIVGDVRGGGGAVGNWWDIFVVGFFVKNISVKIKQKKYQAW